MSRLYPPSGILVSSAGPAIARPSTSYRRGPATSRHAFGGVDPTGMFSDGSKLWLYVGAVPL